jgi:hypothetical protein
MVSSARPTVARHPAALREEARRTLISRILAGGGIGTFVFLVGLLMWHRAVLGSPEYALTAVRDAFRGHDGTRLAYYADIDAIAQQVADEGVDWLVVQHRRDVLAALHDEVHDDIGTAPDSAQRVQLLKDALAERGGEGVSEALSAGTSDSTNVAQRMSAAFVAMPPLDVLVGRDHLDFLTVGRERRVGLGVVVPVMLEYRELGTEITVSLQLTRQRNRWRVVGVEDLDETLSSIDDAQADRLASLNGPVESQLESMLDVGTPTLTRVPARRGRGELRLDVTVRNASSFPVRAAALLMGTRGDDVHGDMLRGPLSLAPGAAVTTAWTLDEAGARAAWAASQAGRLTVRPRAIEYDSAGTTMTLHLYHSYAEARHRGASVHSAMDSTDSAP